MAEGQLILVERSEMQLCLFIHIPAKIFIDSFSMEDFSHFFDLKSDEKKYSWQQGMNGAWKASPCSANALLLWKDAKRKLKAQMFWWLKCVSVSHSWLVTSRSLDFCTGQIYTQKSFNVSQVATLVVTPWHVNMASSWKFFFGNSTEQSLHFVQCLH